MYPEYSIVTVYRILSVVCICTTVYIVYVCIHYTHTGIQNSMYTVVVFYNKETFKAYPVK